MAYRDQLPARWLHCPRKGEIVAGKFLPFKTLLDDRFNEKVPEEYRFQLPMLVSYVNSKGAQLRMIIDLTKTRRFYDRNEVEKSGIIYAKLECQGRDETPTPEQVATFVQLADQCFVRHPDGIIGVHCTHGFNRTGFLIIAYLIERQGWSLDAAVQTFINARPPGIYKGEYLEDLCRRYGPAETDLEPPTLPDWHAKDNEIVEDDVDDGVSQAKEDQADVRGRKRKLPTTRFVDGVSGINVVGDDDEYLRLQSVCQKMCKWEKSGFPGSQPVSMDTKNVKFLFQAPYRVSWKADGTRYMMLIEERGKVFMFDRDHTVFAAPQFTFPRRKYPDQHIKNTLVDGEMVFDKDGDHVTPRYLIYDIIKFEDQSVDKVNHALRLECVQKEIIEPRVNAEKAGRLDKAKEPFRIRLKAFWDASQTRKVLDNVVPHLGHDNDGLIFSPAREPYIAGQCDTLLKWKPPELNSVDFRLKVVKENKLGELPRTYGQLFVGGYRDPVSELELTKETKQLDGKIVECMWEAPNRKWKFMRVREDKSYPNSHKTAIAVCTSIEQPLTKEALLKVIDSRTQYAKSKQASS